MNSLISPFAKLQQRLKEITLEAIWPSPETAFADYVALSYGQQVAQRSVVADRLGEAPMLASAGYQFAVKPFHRPSTYDAEWASHFDRLASRNAFPVDRQSYFYRPTELIGLCFGAQHCPAIDAVRRAWLVAVMEQGRDRIDSGSPSRLLSAFAASCVGVRWNVLTVQAAHSPLATRCLLHWLTTQGEFLKVTGLDVDHQKLEAQILDQALSEDNQVGDVAEASLVLAVTRSVLNTRIQSQIEQGWSRPVHTKDAVVLITNLCDRFPIAVNALKVRHNNRSTITMTDEYDVQDLLGALLKLHFEDVRAEEWTPSYAGNSSRIDFLLKAFGVLVEVKMTRKGLDQKEIANQLAIDILRYQVHQDCKSLLCFVYDPDGYCKNPTVLQNDLTQKHGALDVFVIVRPLLK